MPGVPAATLTWRRTLVVAAATLAIVGALVARALPGTGASADAQQPAGRAIIIVPGLGAAFGCEGLGTLAPSADATLWLPLWWYIQSAAPELALDVSTDLFVFGYEPDRRCPADAATGASCGSIAGDGGYAERLGRWFGEIARARPDTQFDVLGMSTGGVVAAAWAAGATDTELRQVRSIVALGSPLQGLTGGESAAMRAVLGRSPCARTASVTRDSAAIAAINAPQPPRPAASRRLAPALASRVPILTVRNTLDLLAPLSRTCLPGAASDVVIAEQCDPTGHSCVYTNGVARAAIAAWLSDAVAR